jgi:hypothetical protein
MSSGIRARTLAAHGPSRQRLSSRPSCGPGNTREGETNARSGRVKIKPDRADEALAMIAERGVAMVRGMAGPAAS